MIKENRSSVGGLSSKSYNYNDKMKQNKKIQKREQDKYYAKLAVEEAFNEEYLGKKFAPVDKYDMKHMKKEFSFNLIYNK